MIRRQAYRVFGQLIEGEKSSYLRIVHVVAGLMKSNYADTQRAYVVPLLPTTTTPEGPRHSMTTIT